MNAIHPCLKGVSFPRVLLVGMLLLVVLPQVGCAAQREVDRPDKTIRVMSFNLRRSNLLDTAGGDGWFFRRAGAARVIKAFGPDLLGTQEGFKDQVSFLEGKLKGMAMHGVGRDNGRHKGEYAAIFYRTSRFELLDAGHRWLSKKPDKPGSRTWWSPFPRMMSWVVLRDRKRNRTLLVINTHWDNVSAISRERSAGMVRDLIEQRQTDAVIVTGDFNCAPGSDPYEELIGGGGLVDTFAVAGTGREGHTGTRHGFKGKTDGPRIDWVVVSPLFRITGAAIVRDQARDRRYPSDHFPVTATLEWPPPAPGSNPGTPGSSLGSSEDSEKLLQGSVP